MTENYEHYITKNIKAYYVKRIWAPMIYIIVLGVVWFLFSVGTVLFPIDLEKDADLQAFSDDRSDFVVAELSDLTFTGFTSTSRTGTEGYYYYCSWNNSVMIVLLSPSTCEQGLPVIDQIKVSGRLVEGGKAYDELLTEMSDELEWSKEGITAQVPTVYFSEPSAHKTITKILLVLYFATLLYALLNMLIYLVHILFPFTAPACQNLIVFGNPKKQLLQAEEELATLPQLATEDMFITEHYFIMTSSDANAIVPIDQILWIYKHSTLHKFLWYHFSISYTMHITAKKHLYVHCPKNIKSDIDGIMDYLAEANHDIVVGFSEENRLKVQEQTGKPFHVERFSAFLHKKV